MKKSVCTKSVSFQFKLGILWPKNFIRFEVHKTQSRRKRIVDDFFGEESILLILEDLKAIETQAINKSVSRIHHQSCDQLETF